MASLFNGTEDMEDIGQIYGRLETKCPAPSSTSKALWRLRREYSRLSSHNPSKEVLLERAVAMLADNGHMPGWFNQCPTASGIIASSNNKKSSVDLVHWDETNKHARLIELKTGNNDPLYALREILRYGAAYVFCRVHKDKLPLQGRPLMGARHVSLEVVAPNRYYERYDLAGPLARMRQCLDAFNVGSKIPGLTMSLDALAFPKDFDVPFKKGKKVKEKCDTQHLTTEGRMVRDAFNGLALVV